MYKRKITEWIYEWINTFACKSCFGSARSHIHTSSPANLLLYTETHTDSEESRGFQSVTEMTSQPTSNKKWRKKKNSQTRSPHFPSLLRIPENEHSEWCCGNNSLVHCVHVCVCVWERESFFKGFTCTRGCAGTRTNTLYSCVSIVTGFTAPAWGGNAKLSAGPLHHNYTNTHSSILIPCPAAMKKTPLILSLYYLARSIHSSSCPPIVFSPIHFHTLSPPASLPFCLSLSAISACVSPSVVSG